MGSGRHGAARPPIGVLVRRDRVDFALLGLIIAVAVVVMAVSGWADPAFWLAFLLIIGGVALVVRRVNRLSRAESDGDEDIL